MSKILKIAMVNTARTRGGAARMAATLTDAINQSDSNIQSVLYHAEDTDIGDGFHGLEKTGARQLNALLARVGGSLCVADLGVADDIIELSRDADILHLHNLHGYYLNYPKLLAAWRDRPIVWTWHDMWGATGRCGIGYQCNGWKSGCKGCPDKSLYPSAWINHSEEEFKTKNKLFLNLENLWIVSPSEWMSEIARESGFNPDRIKIIRNAADNKTYRVIQKLEARNQLDLPESAFAALFIASNCADGNKGYADFAKAIENTDILGVAVGQPPKNPSAHIFHAGTVMNTKKINSYYAAADVMVIPSYLENYPNTVIESMMSGTPVIGYDEGGIPSQLDVPFCKLVRKGDIAGLRDAIAEQQRSCEKTDSMSETISAIANQRWAPSTAMNAYSDLYREALQYSTQSQDVS